MDQTYQSSLSSKGWIMSKVLFRKYMKGRNRNRSKVWFSPFSRSSYPSTYPPYSPWVKIAVMLTFCRPVGVNTRWFATWLMPQRPFDSFTFLTPLKGESNLPPIAHVGLFQRHGSRHHMVNYSFIFSQAAIAIRQGFALIIIGFDMDAVPLRFMYHQFFLSFLFQLSDICLFWRQSDA